MTQSRPTLIDALIQGWWLVVVTAVVGASVAAGITLTARTEYDANAIIKVDTPTVLRESRLPNPDAMVAKSEVPEFIEELTAEHGGDIELKAYAEGTPQTKVIVRVRSADEAKAAAAAKDAGTRLIEKYEEAAEPLVTATELNVRANDAALQALKGRDDASAFYRWSVEKAAIEEKEDLKYLQNAYTYDGTVETGPSSRTMAAGVAALGGGLLGLALGVVLAWMKARKNTPAA